LPTSAPPQSAGDGGPSNQIRENAQMVNVAQSSGADDARSGQMVFEHQACVNCHTIKGTMANGRFGPDLTHLMSRDTLGAGIMPNNQRNLVAWITDPNNTKPGCLMPAMHLTEEQNAKIAAYLLTLH
jgi:cytochrome c oxidase subunit 2